MKFLSLLIAGLASMAMAAEDPKECEGTTHWIVFTTNIDDNDPTLGGRWLG
jgi:hypothetical protein